MSETIIEKKDFSELITIIMDELDISEENFSRLFDVSRSTVIRWKKGDIEPTGFVKSILYETLIQILIERLKESKRR